MGLEFYTSRLADAVNWARKYSLFQYPFVTACCGMEFMAVWAPKYDVARFGAEFPRFSPRQADLLIIVGTITERQGPVLRRIYEQMCEPKWTVAFGVCASTGGFYQNYSTMPGADQCIPIDVYIRAARRVRSRSSTGSSCCRTRSRRSAATCRSASVASTTRSCRPRASSR